MNVKLLVAAAALFTSTSVLAYCANTRDVINDVNDLQHSSSDLAYDASRQGEYSVQETAKRLWRNSESFERTVRHASNCAEIFRDYNISIVAAFTALQNAYRNSYDYSGSLEYDMRRVENAYYDLSYTMNQLRDRYPRRSYDPIPRYPHRRYEPIPRYPHRRYDPPRNPRRHRPAPVPRPPRTRPAPRNPRHRPAPAPRRPSTRPAPAPRRPSTRPAPSPRRPSTRPAPRGPRYNPPGNGGRSPRRSIPAGRRRRG
ncbi:MAG: hypothetical protein CME64_11680 [Halobacteriovoraceae bacterium]|nr:hypothetical protein [Halobacteriovoraceae bacterium]|tara:strand:- start:85783 stop:86550 length:768 start_codon:yes stop_codon:yes gene_type:complete